MGTKTLVKNSIVQVDATPFRQWYEAHYGVEIGKKKKSKSAPKKEEGEDEETKKSSHVLRKLKGRQATRTLDPQLDDQFSTGRLYACISSRPGQSGAATATSSRARSSNSTPSSLRARSRQRSDASSRCAWVVPSQH